MVDLNQQLFASGQIGGASGEAGEKPVAAAATAALAVGVNLQDAKGLANFDTKSIFGADMANQAILKMASSEKKGNFVERIMKGAANDLQIGKIKPTDGSASGGGSSGGGSSASSGSGAPVSSGGGGGAPAARGGSGDAGLASAVASLQGVGGLAPMEISAAVNVQQDFTPIPIAQVVAPPAPSQDSPSVA